MRDADVAAAYDNAAAAWKRGPEAAYARMAEALVATAPVPLAGARVLDVGAGTAVAGRAALAAGAASVVAADIATGMLRYRGPGIDAVCADAARLPFGSGTFDLVTASFCLGHLPEPARAVEEIRRVSTALSASAFTPDWTHPVKAAVDEAMAGFGFAIPIWYRELKEGREAAVNDPDALERLARGAGFSDVRVVRLEVDTGLSSAADIVDWRLGMAHLAAFFQGLPAHVQVEARAAAEAAVGDTDPVVIPILALSAS